MKNDQDKISFTPRNNAQKQHTKPTANASNYDDDDAEEADTYIIVNNSPIEFGHSLIVPRIKSGLNQVYNRIFFVVLFDFTFLSLIFSYIFFQFPN